MRLTDFIEDLKKAKKKFEGVEFTVNNETYSGGDTLTVVEEPISVADSTMSEGDRITLLYEAEHDAWGYDVYVFETSSGKEIGIKQAKFESLIEHGYITK